MTPITSLGFAVADFAVWVGRPLDPWQRWLVIHAMELLPDGRPRFRQVLVLVARQNGKTELLVVLSLFWLAVQQVPLVLGTSTKLDYAAESWRKAIKLAKSHPDLRSLIPPKGVRRANGEQQLTFAESGDVEGEDACRYKIAASNDEGGRSLTVHRLVEDELRQHHDWSAHEAAENAMNAVPDAQSWAISNAGELRSVVLNSMRASALEHLEKGDGDDRLGLFEWSAPEGAEVDDPAALAAANPNLGHRIDPDALMGKAIRAKAAGGEQEAKFRTEVLCQSVRSLTPPKITQKAWDAVLDATGSWDGQFVVAYDVAMDSAASAVAVAGRRGDGRIQVEVLRHAPGTDWVAAFVASAAARHGGAAVVRANDYATNRAIAPALTRAGWDVDLVGVGDFAAGCAWLAQAVADEQVTHLADPALAAALDDAATAVVGDGAWRWARKDSEADISPLVAVTIAGHGLDAVPEVEVGAFYL